MTAHQPAPEYAGAPATAAALLASGGTVAEPRRGLLRWAITGLGLLLLAALVYQAGPRRLAMHVRTLGWWAPVILVPYAIASAFDAAGWRATFLRRPPRLTLLYVVRLIGEAVNNVTPTAYLGGEPVKAYVLERFGVPLADGTTSVILAKTALTIAQIAFVILGIALLLARRGATWTTIPLLLVLLACGAGVTALLVRWQRRGLVASIARGVARIFPRAGITARLRARATDVDAQLRAFYEARGGAAVSAVVLHLLGWIAGAAEVFAIMALIGRPVTWMDAVIIEALAQPTRLLGIVVPATVGVQEACGMLIFGLLGLAPELGLTLMLLKRVREIAYSLVGLALLGRVRPSEVLAVPAARARA